MDAVDFLCLTLAASGWVDVWRNGGIFAEARAMLEAIEDDAGEEPAEPAEAAEAAAGDKPPANQPGWLAWLASFAPPRLAEGLNCHYCFSHHTPYLLALAGFLPGLWLAELCSRAAAWDAWASASYGLSLLLRLPVWSLAATRLGNILNACLPAGANYERE